ncbi:hypothetical protein D7D52_09755 [Nocardia yunnanensis]|uniref:Homing endonuclease LAGLIDADG domain-containing protein n=1 Tax=Nocardia yunnanensis TaxID=2382165 RepID=A0A386ZAH0_9NOCA|nr:hypothetical protein [Nocardia yunnanensis]AYF74104.1 hypothetical protein D7D52_09755 [Nocardia yunnanensis]
MLELAAPETSYMVGLFQTDGSHYGSTAGKGKLSLELAARDGAFLTELQRHIPGHSVVRVRTRDTNFRTDYVTHCLEICTQAVRADFERFGVPTGRKSETIRPPTGDFSRPDYLRGIIDGDGSIGFTANGYPFISLVTTSPFIAEHFCAEIEAVCGVSRSARPNKRDGAVNVMIANAAAVALARWCYTPRSLAMPRKSTAAEQVSAWTAPSNRFGHTRKHWTAEDDEIVLLHPVPEAARLLERSEKSVYMRRWRLVGPKRRRLRFSPDQQNDGG